MLKRILLYSFAAIFLGIVVMLLPLILYLPMLASTTMQQALPATEESGKASFNVTNVKRTLSLSEAAQIYGKNDIAVGGKGTAVFSPLNILIPLLLVVLAGLLAALVVRIIAGEKLGLQLES
ncbi:MAG TPA: hypothetical protein ENF42_00875 [Candidatus Bathyarchaeota archaeon]|nr:hypothetical protein [Candidatus Bathyarchaeota archaeon]